ncbi:hypothetical protein GQ43DRAFT_501582 [Delitschia confertaspora ATCC 74209]|uniref:Zn(2)-C6 fungal-type domain-containing protein n=1 Tax=Delitschia confertaspora ATCC 74209 TaxID=1513339 RepID=A0A9P4JSL7_9PLEO|nr:hypothetical protein GQ43DRAFT_501582 [Delitschia confertaspora ATCC 74209]
MEAKSHQPSTIIYWDLYEQHNPQHSTFDTPFQSRAPSQQPAPQLPNQQQPTLPTIPNGSKKRRACNECKQQKLRCDLSALPTHTNEICSRCKRLGLDCRIDQNFKRERKRKRSYEHEKEVDLLKRELSRRSVPAQSSRRDTLIEVPSGYQTEAFSSGAGSTGSFTESFWAPLPMLSMLPNTASSESITTSRTSGTAGAPFSELYTDNVENEAEWGLAHLVHRAPRALGTIRLSADEIDTLFQEYFLHYHPFLPVLDPGVAPQEYYHSSRLLFWAAISVASRRCDDQTLLPRLAPLVTDLTWKILQSTPHSKEVAQSLALLCAWPFPNTTGTPDASYIWAGTMIQICVQMGLHRSTSAQDFTKFPVRLTDSEIADRLKTWAACNIVAQSVSIGNGLVAPVQGQATRDSSYRLVSFVKLDSTIEFHFRVEMFRDSVSRSMTSSGADPVGILPTEERIPLYKTYAEELERIEGFAGEMSEIHRFYILAARYHLQSFYLFDEASSEAYTERILTLYFTACSLVQHSLHADRGTQTMLRYGPASLPQTFVSATFLILKVLKNNYFTSFLDTRSGINLLHASLSGIRATSVVENDCLGRIGDILAYMWTNPTPDLVCEPGKKGLQLRIRTRMSMSILWDLLWKFQEHLTSHINDNCTSHQERGYERPVPETTPHMLSAYENTPFVPNRMYFHTMGNAEFAWKDGNFNIIH